MDDAFLLADTEPDHPFEQMEDLVLALMHVHRRGVAVRHPVLLDAETVSRLARGAADGDAGVEEPKRLIVGHGATSFDLQRPFH